MKQFTEGQLQPAAQAIADGAMPAAKTVTEGYIQPAADAVARKASMIKLMGTIEFVKDCTNFHGIG